MQETKPHFPGCARSPLWVLSGRFCQKYWFMLGRPSLQNHLQKLIRAETAFGKQQLQTNVLYYLWLDFTVFVW